jgi:hypothetical protein
MTISNLSVFAIVCQHFINDVHVETLVDMANTLAPYAERLVELNATAEEWEVGSIIIHDYCGLSTNDEFFVPQLSYNS